MNLLHEIRTNKLEKFRRDYRWRTQGRSLRITEMEPRHLFYSVRMMVNRVRATSIGQGNLYVRTAEGYVTRHREAETIFMFVWEIESRGGPPDNLRTDYHRMLGAIFDAEFLSQYVNSGHLRGVRPTYVSREDELPSCFAPATMRESIIYSPNDTMVNGRLNISDWFLSIPEAFQAGAAEAAGECERSCRGMEVQRAITVFIEQFQRKKMRALEVGRLTTTGWTPKSRIAADIHAANVPAPRVSDRALTAANYLIQSENSARSWRDMFSNAFPRLSGLAGAGVNAAQAADRFQQAMSQMNGIFIDTEGTSQAAREFSRQVQGRAIRSENSTATEAQMFTGDNFTNEFEVTTFRLRDGAQVFVDNILSQPGVDYTLNLIDSRVVFRPQSIPPGASLIRVQNPLQLRGIQPNMIIFDELADLPNLTDDAVARMRDAFMGVDFGAQEQRVLIDMESRGLDPNDTTDVLAYSINPLTGIPIPRPKIDNELNLNKKPETTVETLTQVGRRKMIVDEDDNEL